MSLVNLCSGFRSGYCMSSETWFLRAQHALTCCLDSLAFAALVPTHIWLRVNCIEHIHIDLRLGDC